LILQNITVAGEAIQLSDDDTIKLALRSVLYHALEVRPIVRFAGQGAVNVLADHGIIVPLGVFVAIAELSSDGLFRLDMGGIVGVNDGICLHSTHLIIIFYMLLWIDRQ
jgi:hypothetical protein